MKIDTKELHRGRTTELQIPTHDPGPTQLPKEVTGVQMTAISMTAIQMTVTNLPIPCSFQASLLLNQNRLRADLRHRVDLRHLARLHLVDLRHQAGIRHLLKRAT